MKCETTGEKVMGVEELEQPAERLLSKVSPGVAMVFRPMNDLPLA